MKMNLVVKKLEVMVLSLMILSLSFSSVFAQAENGHYKVEPGDALQVYVVDHPEFAALVTVVADGTVTLPMLGAVNVQGMAIYEITKKVEKLYNENFIVNPAVIINLQKTEGNKFYLYGEVRIPGVYDHKTGIRVLQAIITGGGFTDYAGKNAVKILREVNNEYEIIIVKVGSIVKTGNIKEDVVIMPGDIIVVPESLF
jgi:protein involved in polysaccharide export with SLBB domain